MEKEAIEAIIHDVILSTLPCLRGEDIHAERHLKELGADSVDRVEIIVTLLQTLKLEIPLASFSQLGDLRALSDFLYQAVKQRQGEVI